MVWQTENQPKPRIEIDPYVALPTGSIAVQAQGSNRWSRRTSAVVETVSRATWAVDERGHEDLWKTRGMLTTLGLMALAAVLVWFRRWVRRKQGPWPPRVSGSSPDAGR